MKAKSKISVSNTRILRKKSLMTKKKKKEKGNHRKGNIFHIYFKMQSAFLSKHALYKFVQSTLLLLLFK